MLQGYCRLQEARQASSRLGEQWRERLYLSFWWVRQTADRCQRLLPGECQIEGSATGSTEIRPRYLSCQSARQHRTLILDKEDLRNQNLASRTHYNSNTLCFGFLMTLDHLLRLSRKRNRFRFVLYLDNFA